MRALELKHAMVAVALVLNVPNMAMGFGVYGTLDSGSREFHKLEVYREQSDDGRAEHGQRVQDAHSRRRAEEKEGMQALHDLISRQRDRVPVAFDPVTKSPIDMEFYNEARHGMRP